MSEILVVGSVAYDTISTPQGKVENVLGGSANYFSMCASLYSKVNVIGVVGDDYQNQDYELLHSRNVSLEGLQKVSGKTFHWEGMYKEDMNEAITLDTQLNVFEHFNPQLPDAYKKSDYVFLANIDPELQLQVLEQMDSPKLVGVDTMNFWIDSKKDALEKILSKVDVFLLNEGEARKLSGTWNTISAVKKLRAMGPKAIVVKRGEYGFLMYAEDQLFVLPAYPVEDVIDPTGAGDTFAGGFFGYLSQVDKPWSLSSLKQACIQGCLMASFTVEGFGVESLKSVDWPAIEKRRTEYEKIIDY